MDTRNPAVEGRFYPSTKEETFAFIEQVDRTDRYPEIDQAMEGIIGAILPHAGHVYSAYQTIPFFKLLVRKKIRPDTIVILNPNHTGLGETIALDEHAFWSNDAGVLELDQELSRLLPYPKDSWAHKNEHSCEVILPFIQYYYGKDIKILPISMRSRSSADAEQLGESLYTAVNKLKRQVLVIASSDFSHFQTPDEGFSMDQMVLDKIEQKEIHEVEKVVRQHDISVCGSGPIMSLMSYAARASSRYGTKILARGHSGEVSPSDEVVDYISILYYF